MSADSLREVESQCIITEIQVEIEQFWWSCIDGAARGVDLDGISPADFSNGVPGIVISHHSTLKSNVGIIARISKISQSLDGVRIINGQVHLNNNFIITAHIASSKCVFSQRKRHGNILKRD